MSGGVLSGYILKGNIMNGAMTRPSVASINILSTITEIFMSLIQY